jgi:hypothetical protein
VPNIGAQYLPTPQVRALPGPRHRRPDLPALRRPAPAVRRLHAARARRRVVLLKVRPRGARGARQGVVRGGERALRGGVRLRVHARGVGGQKSLPFTF